MNRPCHYLAAALAAVFAAAGCSGQFVKVTGRLTYKGQPVPSTYVIFQPDEEGKRASRGVTDDDGRFMLTTSKSDVGALRGRHTVFLKYHLTAEEEMGHTPPKASKELRAVIAKYADPKTSPLHYDITGNGQVIDIDLQ